ncbi:hypothetical protein [Litorimonas sp. WD9-15]|uniref:hypothetical protein n=1 Tax=Litorimonas sp. WD9-15 TaxID=3418716 RepID=UPI003D048F05
MMNGTVRVVTSRDGETREKKVFTQKAVRLKNLCEVSAIPLRFNPSINAFYTRINSAMCMRLTPQTRPRGSGF